MFEAEGVDSWCMSVDVEPLRVCHVLCIPQYSWRMSVCDHSVFILEGSFNSLDSHVLDEFLTLVLRLLCRSTDEGDAKCCAHFFWLRGSGSGVKPRRDARALVLHAVH